MPEWIIKYWVEWVFGVVVAILGVLIRKINTRVKETSAKNDAIELGIQALLRAQLVDDYNHYMSKGEFPIYARESFENVYKQYRNLGGNGVMVELHKKLIELPTPNDKD